MTIFSFFSSPAFNTAVDIPPHYFKEKRKIKCVVVKVSDGDTYKLRHITRWRSDHAFTGSLKDNTIAVRIAAVDTPETSKSSHQTGQKYAEEAKAYATQRLLGKTVTLKLLSVDQYKRVIGLISYRESGLFVFASIKRDISEQLLLSGLAVVYRQGGAQYDGGVARWDALEATAKRKKRGIWSSADVHLPSDYKKKLRSNNQTHQHTATNQV